ncbi:VOC family protein [Bacillus sp. 31A1R]|uniref:VOC family protein n=1 Tax=Robertmurraya mangrovi TaxID=3098077 RepID=A0ABU5J0G6_9BACI|nr:VOC family protein [Bacillus sp. 31A1R]MDZ5472896.1 VOC family protein [Bacillus sp. 31A1R]
MIQKQTVSVVKGINCIYIPTSNIKKSATWYMENLNLVLLIDVNEESTQAQLKITPEQSIFLIKTPEKFNLTYKEIDGHEQCLLTLEVTNINDLHEKLRNNLDDIEEIQDHNECGSSFYIKDPDGNKIDIWGGWG